MRILLVEPDLQDDGALRVSLDRAAHWQALGAEVVLLVIQHSATTGRLTPPAGLPVEHASRRPRRLRRLLPTALWRAWRLALRSDVVVLGREVGLGLFVGALAARLARRPCAVTVQSRADAAMEEFTPRRLHRANRAVLVRAGAVVCVSAGLVPGLVAMGASAERVHVVRNGIDVARIREAASAEPEPPLPRGPVIVGSGRLTRQKGFDVLIAAHAAVLARGGPSHSLVILGDGPDRGALAVQAEALGCSSTVFLPGHTGNPHAVVSRADLFVLSSRWEGYSLVVAEAVSLGVPVLAADCVSGPSEVLEGGAFGRLVATADVDVLARAVLEHLADPADLRARAAAGARVAAGRWDPHDAAQRHLGVLASLTPAR